MKRTGVIVAVQMQLTVDQALNVTEQLEERFPGVTFALAAGALSSVAFEWDDGDGAGVAAVVHPAPSPDELKETVR